MLDDAEDAGVPAWESCFSNSLILNFIDSKSIDVLSVGVDADVELSGDGALLLLLVTCAGAMATVWPGIGCGLVSYTQSAFLDRTQLLQGDSLLQRILRRLHKVHELVGH